MRLDEYGICFSNPLNATTKFKDIKGIDVEVRINDEYICMICDHAIIRDTNQIHTNPDDLVLNKLIEFILVLKTIYPGKTFIYNSALRHLCD